MTTTCRIEKDTTQRGTVENPVFVIFLKYGNLPQQECWLRAKTERAAVAEARERFGGHWRVVG